MTKKANIFDQLREARIWQTTNYKSSQHAKNRQKHKIKMVNNNLLLATKPPTTYNQLSYSPNQY